MSLKPRKENTILMNLFLRTKFENGCFIWTGSNNLEYGKISYRGKGVLTHRLAYSLCVGDIEPGKDVSHSCGNKLCVNPLHLYLSTKSSRQRSAVADGTWKLPPKQQGTKHKGCKLNNEKVIDIYTDRSKTRAQMAEKYGVSPDTIKKIRTGHSWTHITENLKAK